MSHHQVNNKCNWVKRQCWQIYALCNFLLYTLPVFRSNHNCSWKFHKFHRKTPVLGSLFFLTMIKLYNNICSAWISCITANFFLIDWCHKCLKMQSICCYFAEKTFMDCWKVIYENIEKKNSQQTYLYIPVILVKLRKTYRSYKPLRQPGLIIPE